MALVSLVVTMNGSAQKISGFTDIAKQVLLQADTANAAVVKVGDLNVSSSVYGILIPIPTATIPAAPISINGPIQVDSIFVLGANNEKIRVTIVTA